MRVMASWIAVVACSLWAVPASADSDCELVRRGATLLLRADCTTTETLVIPDGLTLDGGGHTITAVDPEGDHFRGAVLRNGGAEAHVRRLGITTDGLRNVCDAPGPDGDDRLRGILFDGASGSIVQSRVLALNQGASGCQEGNGIEVRNDGGGETPRVFIAFNEVRAYQKTGILVNGDVEAKVFWNTVRGLGPVDYIAQNGIQIGYGARALVQLNDVADNIFTRGTFSSAGILLQDAAEGVVVAGNGSEASDVGLYVSSTSRAHLLYNRAVASTFAGVLVDGRSGPAASNVLALNHSREGAVGFALVGEGARDNRLRHNRATAHAVAGLEAVAGAEENLFVFNRALRNDGDGFLIEGGDNRLYRNVALGNGELDIRNEGDNRYRRNRCRTSSGPPVRCGTEEDHGFFALKAAAAPASFVAPASPME